MKVRVKYGVGFGQHSETIVLDDGLSDDEIQAAVFEHIVSNVLDFGWEMV